MSANCATWTSERIELLKRCLHAGLSCGQTAREIGVMARIYGRLLRRDAPAAHNQASQRVRSL
jgi:hypothetical protein